jgi:hypothetical protein
VGFAHRRRKLKSGIRLSPMIVADSHSESGCHEPWIFFSSATVPPAPKERITSLFLLNFSAR